LNPNFAIFKPKTTTPIILHKSTNTSININLRKNQTKQEHEIGNELKDWELGVTVLAFKHNKKLCTPIAFWMANNK
jgi:hypothetical protein